MAHDGADAIAAGTMVGAYRIERRIGGGGMGAVYAAEEPTIKKRVAIKVLRHALAGDASNAARFEREARAANDVHHPAIVDVFAFGKLDDGRPYLVMSLLEGRSLREEIAHRGRIPPAEAWAWAREIGEALAAAHEVGIVHRDVKPDNVFLERFGGRPAKPRLLDLGLVKVMPDADDDESAAPMKLTQSGVPMGTPAYMAPEQWWGSEIDARVDQYGFAITLFEMLAGHPPFQSQQYIELAQQHLHTPPPELAGAESALPPAVDTFIARALAKAPADRFASMNALVEAGNAAFMSVVDPALAFSETKLAQPADAKTAEALPSSAGPSLGRFLLVHLFIVFGGLAAIVGIGFAGPDRHGVREWMRNGGPSMWPIPIVFLAGAVCVVASARKRARSGTPSLWPWVLALSTVLLGALGTYTGWNKSASALGELAPPLRFVVLHEGAYEFGVPRFVGFYLASLLLASIAAEVGIHKAPDPSSTLVRALGTRRAESIAAASILFALAIVAVFFGAPSGALAAAFAAFIALLDLVLPPLGALTAARDELERAVAGLLALVLVVAVAMARIDAREAVLWISEPTRAARATEIAAAAGEWTTTLAIALVSLLVLAGVEAMRLKRVWRHGGAVRLTTKTLALIAIVGAVGIGDVVQHARFASMSDRLHGELEAQFSLFANLDPPVGGELDPNQHAPHPAPALQIARNVIALNAQPVAPLSATDSAEGASNVGRDLSHALAEHAAHATDETTDLAVSIDRRVPWNTALTLFAIARRSGARRLELYLTRGPPLQLPGGAPIEASWVLASDFVAIGVELADDGFRASGDETFGAIAPELVRRALAGDSPIRIATAPR